MAYGYTYNSKSYIHYLKQHGANIGDDVNLFHVRQCHIDATNPHLINIGNHVNITGACILTHDYSWCVIKGINGEILGNQKPVNIGNNVFIGYGTVVLGGSVIGDNVIIGANSLVCSSLESNSVYAGVPAKRICDISTYIEKRHNAQISEAVNFVKSYEKAHHHSPPEEALHEYFFLFSDNNIESTVFKDKLLLCDNYDLSVEYLSSHKPVFPDYKSFLEFCDSNNEFSNMK